MGTQKKASRRSEAPAVRKGKNPPPLSLRVRANLLPAPDVAHMHCHLRGRRSRRRRSRRQHLRGGSSRARRTTAYGLIVTLRSLSKGHFPVRRRRRWQ